MEEREVNEVTRIYRYADGTGVSYDDVKTIRVSASGNHYLKTGDGLLHIISPGWQSIHINPGEGKGWTF